jgi:hypothetical protein
VYLNVGLPTAWAGQAGLRVRTYLLNPPLILRMGTAYSGFNTLCGRSVT